jgi:hypothetical protein
LRWGPPAPVRPAQRPAAVIACQVLGVAVSRGPQGHTKPGRWPLASERGHRPPTRQQGDVRGLRARMPRLRERSTRRGCAGVGRSCHGSDVRSMAASAQLRRASGPGGHPQGASGLQSDLARGGSLRPAEVTRRMDQTRTRSVHQAPVRFMLLRSRSLCQPSFSRPGPGAWCRRAWRRRRPRLGPPTTTP